MSDTGKVSRYSVRLTEAPWLWKAQQSFLSAEMLKAKGFYDGAANRFYYAVLQTASHFYAPTDKVPDELKEHGRLTSQYIRDHDRKAQEAVSRAQGARNKGDYTPVRVRQSDIERVFPAVRDMMLRALQKAGITESVKDGD
jgi:hypothetical protein